MKTKNIYLDLKGNNINIKEGISYKNKEYIIVSNTDLYDLNYNKISLKKVLELYEKNIELGNFISNLFTIIIYNKKSKKITFIQDMNGDSIPIYYYVNENILIVSNKLKKIISSNNEININDNSINYFIKKGYIPNKKTLISGVNKLIPKKNLTIDLITKKEVFKNKCLKFNYTEKNTYFNEMEKIVDFNSKNKSINITLSSGYDSNLIFSFLDKNNHIEAYSIGGVIGVDETKVVLENIKKYSNINLNTGYVDTFTLNNYPKLIYYLEGSVYEQGIFLQYELMKKVKDKTKNNTIMFCGEGADQVFSLEYFMRFLNPLIILKNLYKRCRFFKEDLLNLNIKGGFIYKNHVFNFLSYIIMKKNGILMNEIGVNVIYPYISKNIVNIAYKERFKNNLDKKTHKEFCKEIIEPDIYKNIVKLGGTTEPIALFKYCTYIKDIENLVNKSKYNILKIKNKNIKSKNYLNYLLRILYLEIFEYLFIKNKDFIEEKSNMKLYDVIKDILKNMEVHNEKNYKKVNKRF